MAVCCCTGRQRTARLVPVRAALRAAAGPPPLSASCAAAGTDGQLGGEAERSRSSQDNNTAVRLLAKARLSVVVAGAPSRRDRSPALARRWKRATARWPPRWRNASGRSFPAPQLPVALRRRQNWPSGLSTMPRGAGTMADGALARPRRTRAAACSAWGSCTSRCPRSRWCSGCASTQRLGSASVGGST
eukprot:5186028-Prymnesium_polylepis.1